jgi:glycosyltransferase involved in cell wall biosynthesis
VTVLAERFDDFRSDEKFDAITLIGVLEYASMFSGGDDPACSMLARVRQLLKPEGRLFIAIENQLGLKYFAGGPEDHIGQAMYGIEGRYQLGQPKTYGRHALAQLLRQAGFENTEFLAPFPDYKFPISLVTENGFAHEDFDASAFAWQSVTRDPQLPPHTHFNLALAWPVIFDNGLGLEVSNSFLVIASRDKQERISRRMLAYHYNSDRRREYCKETRFVVNERNEVVVKYRRLMEAVSMSKEASYQMTLSAEAAYVRGRPLSQEFVRLVNSPGWTLSQVTSLVRRYLDLLLDLVGAREGFDLVHDHIPGRLVDALPQNILIGLDGGAELIDMEWERRSPCEIGYVVFRALLWLSLSIGKVPPAEAVALSRIQFIKRLMIDVDLNVTDEDLRRYELMEREFQRVVSDARKFPDLDHPLVQGFSTEHAGSTAALYFAADGEPFSETNAIHTPLRMGRQVIRFSLGENRTIIQQLRCDPVSRRQWFVLHNLEVLDASARRLWSFPQEHLDKYLINLEYVLDCQDGPLLTSKSDDPQILIPISDISTSGDVCYVALDIELVSDAWAAQRLVTETRSTMSLREQLLDTSAKLTAAEANAHSAMAKFSANEQSIADLRRTIIEIHQSTSWRVTRPLRQLRKLPKYLLRTRRGLLQKIVGICSSRFWISLEPAHQIEPTSDSGTYVSTGTDPYFIVRPKEGVPFPTGICRIRFKGACEETPLMPELYVDDGNGMREQLKFSLGVSLGGWTSSLVRLPKQVVALRLDPISAPGQFTLDGFEISGINAARVMAEKAVPTLLDSVRNPSVLLRRLGVARRLLRDGGVAGVKEYLMGQRLQGGRSYNEWVAAYDSLTDSRRAMLVRAAAELVHKPVISVVMPVYNPPVGLLDEAIHSVRRQIYPHWELCIADDASPNPEVTQLLKKHAAEDKRIKLALRDTNGHISAASNSALELVSGEFVALLDHDDLLAESALYWVAKELNMNPNAAIIYSDEDKIDMEGVRTDPYFKCDWNYDLFLSHNLISHLGVYRTELIRSVEGFREGYEGSQDYDLALRCVERVDASQIKHIPRILYHWRVLPGSTALAGAEKPYALIAGGRALEAHLQRKKIKANVEFIKNLGGYRVHYELPTPCPLVTLIIPTRNGLDLVRQCVESILGRTCYQNYEILIVDNGSDDPEILRYFASIEAEFRIRVLRDDRPFNYSALNNHAVSVAQGDVIGLINNDIEVISPDWLDEMVAIAMQPDVGAVGARLWYPDDTLQHGGVIMGVGGIANHAHKGVHRGVPGYFGRAELMQSFSAVTAACLLVRRDLYESVGGLDEENLAVAYNDVDFCLKLGRAGYRNVWTPFAQLYHHESATRGADDTPEKRARFEAESLYMSNQWSEVIRNDPAYNPNLTLMSEDFSLAWPPRVDA